MTATPHVIIIGAGTGGMCLAHGLRRDGVSVAVYERYRTRTDGLHGYRVGIDPTGNRALRDCLPPELFATFLATCARSPRSFNVLTGRMGRTATFPLRPDHDPVNSERSVSRMTLRQVLLTGMDDVVHFDKTFVRYERHDDGTVTAHFADGTSDTGHVLVAADGTRSAVRAQLDRGVPGLPAPLRLLLQGRVLRRWPFVLHPDRGRGAGRDRPVARPAPVLPRRSPAG
jgi:2-polyprenyl-6-methoxyphenol hydroxylase-like FAD-dependent oxidoreductase